MSKPLDAESIIKAMKEAGVYGSSTATAEGKVGIYGYGTDDQWSRFRGVPLEEVEDAVREMLWEALPNYAGEYEVNTRTQQVMRRLRGGD